MLSEWLEGHANNRGCVTIDIKEARSGKFYCELNQYEPKPKEEKEEDDEPNPDDIPFN